MIAQKKPQSRASRANQSAEREERIGCRDEGSHDCGRGDDQSNGEDASDGLQSRHEDKNENRERGVVEKAGANAQTGCDFGIEEVNDYRSSEERENGDGNDAHSKGHFEVEVGEAEDVSKKPGIEVLVRAQPAEDHNAGGKSTGVENGEDCVVVDFCFAGKENGENADEDRSGNGTHKCAYDTETYHQSRDGDPGKKTVAECRQFQRAAMQQNEGAGVAIDEANDDGRDESALVEVKIKGLDHDDEGGRSEECASPRRWP